VSVLAFIVVAAAAAGAPQPESDLSIKETRRILDDYGTCIVKRWPKVASEAIVRNVDNHELLTRYKRLIDGSCLPVRRAGALRVRFMGDQYRYALADALVRRELAAQPAPILDGVPMLVHREAVAPGKLSPKGKPLTPAQYAAALKGYEEAKAFNFISRYGECVVRVNPAAVRALLLSRPETDEERMRFTALSTAFGTCLPEGQTLSFGKLPLRGTLAVNYYRLAMAAASMPRAPVQ